MIRSAIDKLLGKMGLRNFESSRVSPQILRTVGADEKLLYEAIAYNVNKNDRALYNLLHCSRLLRDGASKIGETFSGKTILEIGTSREPGLPLILLLMGCKDYYASNIRNLDDWLPAAYINLIRLVMSGVPGSSPGNIDEIVSWAEGAGRSGGTAIGRLREQCFHNLSPTSAENIALTDGSMDTIFSLAVLEHVHRPQAVIDNIFRMTKPGGWGLHAIDLRDHRDFDKPLDFLKLDEASYSAARPNGENRWRASDFLQAFAAAGFEIVATELVDGPITLNDERNCDTAKEIVEPTTWATRLEDCSAWVTKQQRATFVSPYSERSLQDLSVISMSLLCRKPADQERV